MKRLVFLLLMVMLFANPVYAQGKSQSKGNKDSNYQQEEAETISDTIGDILIGDDDDRPGKNNNKHQPNDHKDGGLIEGVKDIIFGPDEEKTIGDYYSKNRVNLDTLPPGIAKNLARGKPLPPGIAKKNIPTDLKSQLPDIFGHRRMITGEDIVLVNEETGIVVDILRGILSR